MLAWARMMMVQFGDQSGFTIRVLRAGSPACAGMGFVVGDRHVVTCAHVVNSALGLPQRQQNRPGPDMRVQIEFPMLGDGNSGPVRNCQVAAWLAPAPDGVSGGDVAGLVFTSERLPEGAGIARLTALGAYRDAAVSVFGYPGDPPRFDTGAVARLRLAGGVGGGMIQLDADSSAAVRAQAGYSGSPVVIADTAGDAVLGMLAAAGNGRQTRDSYAIPAVRIASAWPDVVRVEEPATPAAGTNAGDALNWRLQPGGRGIRPTRGAVPHPAPNVPLPVFTGTDSALLSPAGNLDAGNVKSIHFSLDGGLLASRAESSSARGPDRVTIWDMTARRTVGDLDIDGDYVLPLRFSPDSSLLVGETMAPGTLEHGARAWSTDGLDLVASIVDAPGSGWSETISLQFSADGRLLAGIIKGQAGGVRIWDTATFSVVTDLQPRGGFTRWAKFTADGRLFACVDSGVGLRIRVWDTATFEPIARMELDHDAFGLATLSPDGQFMAGAVTGGIEVWNIVTYEHAAMLSPLEWPVRSITASDDGKWLAATAGGGNFMGLFEARQPIYVWDTSDFTEAAVLGNGRKEVCGDVTFRPDGELLAAKVRRPKGEEIRVWQVRTFDRVAALRCTKSVGSLQFSPDGQLLAGMIYASIARCESIGLWSLRPR